MNLQTNVLRFTLNINFSNTVRSYEEGRSLLNEMTHIGSGWDGCDSRDGIEGM